MKKKKKVVAKKHVSAADRISTVICVVLILAVLGLGVWATWKPIKEALKSNDTSTTDSADATDSTDSTEEQQEYTVKTILNEMGITMDDLKNTYGVDTSKLTEESSADEMFDNMNVENFYNLSKASFAQNKPADDADEETKTSYEEAASNYESFDAFIQMMGVDKSEITDGMTATQFQELVSQKQQAAQEASQSEEGSAEGTSDESSDAAASTEEQSDTSEPKAELAD